LEVVEVRLLYVGNITQIFCGAGKHLYPNACGFLLFCMLSISVSSIPAAALDFDPLCYREAGGNFRNVSNCALLDAALSNANPGDVIVLADGDYNCDRILARNGTSSKPIIIAAANPRQPRFISAALTVSGSHIVVANLTFDNSGIKVTGDFNRITKNRFQNNAGALRAAVTVDRGNSNRIDHNEVVDFSTAHRGFRIIPASSGNNTAKKNVIDRNYLHRSLGPRKNGADGIQLGSNSSHTYERLNTIVEYNLMEQWDIDGEMISNKSSNNIIRFNTLANSNAAGPIRLGTFVDVISNYFFGVRALVIQGDDHRAIGNTVENGSVVVKNGDTTLDDLSVATSHPAARRTLVAGNTVINGEICVGCRVPRGNNAKGVPAKFTALRGNKGKVTLLEQQNTTQSSTYDGTVTPAVRLVPRNVGPDAPYVCTVDPPS
jgi:Chondroitinase B